LEPSKTGRYWLFKKERANIKERNVGYLSTQEKEKAENARIPIQAEKSHGPQGIEQKAA
jgi:hypothetical protein